MAGSNKFILAVLMVYLIELGLYLFGGPNVANSSIFNLLFNPFDIENSLMYIAVFAALGFISASVILPGNWISINIYALYSAIVVIVITFVISLMHLWTFLDTELSTFLGDTTVSPIILAVVISPIVWFYLIAVIDWVRSNQ